MQSSPYFVIMERLIRFHYVMWKHVDVTNLQQCTKPYRINLVLNWECFSCASIERKILTDPKWPVKLLFLLKIILNWSFGYVLYAIDNQRQFRGFMAFNILSPTLSRTSTEFLSWNIFPDLFNTELNVVFSIAFAICMLPYKTGSKY